jgi:hypothetical protein
VTLPPLLFIILLFLFFFVAPRQWGRGVPPLPGADIGVMALSVLDINKWLKG